MKKLILLILGLAVPALADINVTPGVGKTVHTDSTGGVEYQYIKITDGTTGGTSSATVTSLGLKVDLTTTTISGSLPAGAAALGQVDIISTGTLNVSQQGNITINALPAGTNNIGTVTGSTIVVQAANNNTTGIPVNLTAGTATQGGVVLQVVPVSGSTATVGYQAGLSSVPVNVLNTVTITGSISNSGFNVTGSLPAGSAALGQVNIVSTGPLTTAVTNVPAVQISSALPAGSATIGSVMIISSSSNNGATATSNRFGVLPGIAQNLLGNNGTAYTQGRDAAVMILTKTGTQGVSLVPDITLPSYVAASTGAYNLASSSYSASWICGNQVDTVTVTQLMVTCTQTTAGIVPIKVFRSTQTFNGAFSTMTMVGDDPNYSTPISSMNIRNFMPTVTDPPSTSVIDNVQFNCLNSAASSSEDFYLSPSVWKMKPQVLRGSNQCIAFNFQGQSMAGAAITVRWNFYEGATP